MSIPGSKHNDLFGDIPPSMDFGDLTLPPGVAQTVRCNRCLFTYTSLDAALSARALARHAAAAHTAEPTVAEARRMRKLGLVRGLVR